jgi:hypothetical protein
MHLACAADSGSPGLPPESWDRFPQISGLNDLLQVAVDYVAANSPVGPVVEGRIVRP